MDETARNGIARMHHAQQSTHKSARSTAIGTLIAVGLLISNALVAQQQASPQSGDAQYSEKKKPDPIEVNGPIFVDWPKPDVTLVFTGEQDGYIEPCGCAGLENQKGGFRRR